jgi:S-disulfanyl-L-cysteine oxidoreductase SoxD
MDMRKTIVMTAAALLAGIATAQAHTIWDGVYSDAQADRGHTMYMQNCSRCHGVNLWGTYEIPPLVGRIMPYYSGSSLEALFEYVSTAMPLDHPGMLPASVNADIVAYLLKANDVPSGSKELRPEAMKAISFEGRPVSRIISK